VRIEGVCWPLQTSEWKLLLGGRACGLTTSPLQITLASGDYQVGMNVGHWAMGEREIQRLRRTGEHFTRLSSGRTCGASFGGGDPAGWPSGLGAALRVVTARRIAERATGRTLLFDRIGLAG